MSSTAILATIIGVFLVLLALVVWSIKRHRDPCLQIDADQPLKDLFPSIAGMALDSPIEGNSAEIIENAAFFEAVLREIRAAQNSVHLETFLWEDGAVGRRIADALAERARAGLTVRVLLDAVGSKKVGKEVEKQMKDAGCKVVMFHHRHVRNIGVFAERDHRKIVVVDGRVAFVGGHCIVDAWANGESRDISVRLRGPIVHAVQSAFSENWGAETGELFVGDRFFPQLDRAGDIKAHVAYAKPEGSAPAVKILHHLIIGIARERLWIQNAYFIPEPEAINAFGEAVKRGVDVRIMTPSMGGSDNPMVQHAAHRNFEKLLRCGVRIFEYPHALLHQKVMTVDSCWCAIGSSNFDDRSFETNDEITVGFLDGELAKQLEQIFERDAADCVEVKLEEWRKRGVWQRTKEQVFYLINEVL
ncbi:MAG TPA: phospholipase D-like domain-containing protein [Burkholderiales bacterium]|nr:phospholipase D-like domain-containing protein [Burkholderiales bacterium]